MDTKPSITRWGLRIMAPAAVAILVAVGCGSADSEQRTRADTEAGEVNRSASPDQGEQREIRRYVPTKAAQLPHYPHGYDYGSHEWGDEHREPLGAGTTTETDVNPWVAGDAAAQRHLAD